jgi:ATP-binding cassette, subfamily C, bacterial LapB
MSDEQHGEWDVGKEYKTAQDPLLACLLFLSKHFNTPASAVTLTERLPLVDNRLTPELFIRAAERAKLAAEINQITFDDIDDVVMPAVLLLKNGEACVLLEKNGDESTILMGKTGQGTVTISNSQLADKYTGYSIFVKPLFQFSKKDKGSGSEQPGQHWFWSVFRKSWPIYTEVLTASLLINLFALAMPLFVMNVYDRVVPNQATETMWVLASGIIIVFLFDLLLKTLRAYFIDAASKKTDIKLSSIIFEHILGIRMESRPDSVGAFANTVQSFELFRDFITSTTITVLVDLPFVFLYLFVIYYIGGSLVVVPIIVLPIVFILGFLLQFPLRRLTQKNYALAKEKNATLIESLAGVEALKTTGAEGAMQKRFEQVVIFASKLGGKLRFWVGWSVNFTLFAQQFASVMVVIWGVYKITEGDLTVGGLIACTILTGRALAPMAQVSGIFSKYYQSVEALHSINDVMKLPTDIDTTASYLHRPVLKGNIEFKNVCYQYPNQTLPILSNISFSVKQGEWAGIIGRTGSGKSTIAKLMLGLYRPSEGNIFIDGAEYTQINPADLRKQMGYVPQDVVLFYGSVKDNIRLGSPYVEDSKLLEAARIAGVNTFTDNHPEGYDRSVGERGCQLSGGQRQSIALARSLILSPDILMFDEPTASMDDGFERTIRDNIASYLKKDTTLLLITRKASMLDLVDRLIVIDNTKLIADGPKNSVLALLKGGATIDKGTQTLKPKPKAQTPNPAPAKQPIKETINKTIKEADKEPAKERAKEAKKAD